MLVIIIIIIIMIANNLCPIIREKNVSHMIFRIPGNLVAAYKRTERQLVAFVCSRSPEES